MYLVGYVFFDSPCTPPTRGRPCGQMVDFPSGPRSIPIRASVKSRYDQRDVAPSPGRTSPVPFARLAPVTRVLLVHQPIDGGVTRHVRDLANGLGEAGYEVVLCGPRVLEGVSATTDHR